MMIVKLTINDELINTAMKIGRHRTKKAAVTAALKEYIRRHKQQQIIELFGTIDYVKGYNYKKYRGYVFYNTTG